MDDYFRIIMSPNGLNNAKMNGFNLKKMEYLWKESGLHNRSVLNFSKSEVNYTIENNLIIRDENGIYTEAYKILTQEFHGVSYMIKITFEILFLIIQLLFRLEVFQVQQQFQKV